jgi:membrane protein implicated in regulation of membrane protease activity
MNYATIWVLTGIVMLIAEMLSGTFVLVFFSLGAFVAALVALAEPDMLTMQIVANALVALAGVFLLRKPLQRKLLKSAQQHHADLGKEIIVDQDIRPHQQARISYQGTTWLANNVGTDEILQGDRATIVGMDSLTLLVRKN